MGGMAPSNLEIALFKQYPFDSAVQRMTVVAKKKGAQYYSVFIKGAPEKVASFCRSETSKTKVLCLLRSSRPEYQNIVLQLIQIDALTENGAVFKVAQNTFNKILRRLPVALCV